MTIGLDVLDVNASQTLAYGAGALVGGQDTFAWGGNVLGVLDQLICVLANKGRHGLRF